MPSIVQVVDWIAADEILIRGACFASVFILMAAWGFRRPARALRLSRGLRWANNLGLLAFSSLVLRSLFPAAAVGMAVVAEEQGWGLGAGGC